MSNSQIPDIVLICINNLGVGGAEKLVVDDINEMRRRGTNVILLTLRKEPKKSLSLNLNINKERWYAMHFKSFFDLKSWIKLFVYIKNLEPSKVITHLWFTNTVMRIVCRFLGIKNVITFEHNIYDTVKSSKMYFIDRLLQSWCKTLVAVSSAVKYSLISHGIRKDRIVVLNNGINISKFNLTPDFDLKAALGLPRHVFVFLSVGRLIKQKGMDILINAFAKIIKEAALIIVGQGEDELKLKEQAEYLKVSERVCFLGVRNDVPELLSFSDCFVLASRYEGFGIVVLEAMAAGKPIIISDFEAGRDVIHDGIDGLVVRREDSEGLAKAMTKMMSDDIFRQNLAQKAKEKSRKFSIENHVSKLLDL